MSERESAALTNRLMALVPADGSAIGNGKLRKLIAEALGRVVPENEYEELRDALVAAGRLLKGQGRGGSVRLSTAVGGDFSLATQERPAEEDVPVRKPGKPRKSGPAGKSPDTGQILSYRHREKRKNNPEVGMVNPESDPDEGKTAWAYDPHLDPALQFDVGRAQVEQVVDDALAAGDLEAMRAALKELKRLSQPYLNWTGKAERTSFDVDTVSLHVHERIDPASILSAVRKRKAKEKGEAESQADLFHAPFENLPLRDAIDFYKHEKGWANRLIAGDSLLVMNSLLQKEGMAGQVQMIYIDPPYGIKYGSNFQPFVNKREVKDRSDEDLTQEPEMIKAFRDTWELGIHSYLTYLRDRVRLARDLLHESGSLFVQISDENVHLIRQILDEVLGVEHFVAEILVKKKGSQKGGLLDPVNDYLVWYGRSPRNSGKLKFYPLFQKREIDAETLSEFNLAEVGDGPPLNLTKAPSPDGGTLDYRVSPARLFVDYPQAKLFRAWPITNGGFRPNQMDTLEVEGRPFNPPRGRCWSFRSAKVPQSQLTPMQALGVANRLIPGNEALDGRRYLDDFPYKAISNWWDGLGGASSPIYVVQTNEQIVQRCLLMTTDPGDLVLDPTCGSGTTAYVAEKWGRRWITCDTSRVATTLAKQRLVTAGYDYFELRYPHEGIRSGFIYETVPHLSLQAIANNPEVEKVWTQMYPSVEAALRMLNLDLQAARAEVTILRGKRKGTVLRVSERDFIEAWEVPYESPNDWPAGLRKSVDSFHAARRAMQRKLDESIAAHAEQEVLYDRPLVSKSKRRITGPFSVEAVPFPTVLALSESEQPHEASTAIARSGESHRQHTWRDELLKAGIRGKGGQVLGFSGLETLPDTRYLHCLGTLVDAGERVVVSFGPEHAALEQRQVELALHEAEKLRPAPKFLIFCAFAFDPEAAKDIDETNWPGMTLLKVQMNTDLLTEDLKKAKSSNQSFWLMGQPDVEVQKRSDGKYLVEVHGFDYFDTAKGELVSGGKGKIAAWILDTDYDERSLFPRQVFFPMAGAKDGWYKLKKDIRAELNEALLDKFHGTVSLPFEAGENRKAAVKIVDDRGIESLKIIPLD